MKFSHCNMAHNEAASFRWTIPKLELTRPHIVLSQLLPKRPTCASPCGAADTHAPKHQSSRTEVRSQRSIANDPLTPSIFEWLCVLHKAIPQGGLE